MVREHITDQAHGVDVSHHQGAYNPDLTWGQTDFVIAKLGEGYNSPYSAPYDITHQNFSQFLPLWEGVAKIPIRGVYHYQRSDYSWEAQATNFLNAIAGLDVKPHMLWCDLEKINNVIDKTMIADTLNIMRFWKANSPYTVGYYGNEDVLINYVQPMGLRYYGQAWLDEFFSYPCWFARYWIPTSFIKDPKVPAFVKDFRVLQYSEDGDSIEVRDGVTMRHYGGVDLNVYNGTVAEMRAWLGLPQETETPEEPPTIPPPTGGTSMYDITPLDPIGSKIRSDHFTFTTAPQIGSLPFGQHAGGEEIWETGSKGQADYGRWLKVNAPVAGWIAEWYAGKQYATITGEPTNPPPPPTGEVAIQQTIEQFVDGVKYIPEQGNPVKFKKA